MRIKGSEVLHAVFEIRRIFLALNTLRDFAELTPKRKLHRNAFLCPKSDQNPQNNTIKIGTVIKMPMVDKTEPMAAYCSSAP